MAAHSQEETGGESATICTSKHKVITRPSPERNPIPVPERLRTRAGGAGGQGRANTFHQVCVPLLNTGWRRPGRCDPGQAALSLPGLLVTCQSTVPRRNLLSPKRLLLVCDNDVLSLRSCDCSWVRAQTDILASISILSGRLETTRVDETCFILQYRPVALLHRYSL
ncbi:hypothetical protein EYF80_015069 [Liparis tanakae]|uniref:Uncharacterized protein n=1 Tax=Liparis tanakae TaxID=230148 RepID=A0A4Z2IAG5_9TELE|nr:hypothetical protein EYF80_015069 [Liparis tanakae]